jgi:hypothetical protein
MPAGYYNMVCEQGATFIRSFTWKDRAGDPVPLEGYTARMQVRRRVNDDEVVMEFTTENGGIEITGPGKLVITASEAETAGLQPMTGVYDLELVSPTDVTTRLLRGQFVIDPEVTR